MRVSDFHFDLPEDLIAQQPPAQRGDSRMLVMDRTTGALTDQQFADLPQHLHPGDLLILNDSRVLPARLLARRTGLGRQQNSPEPTGAVEVLLTHPAPTANQGDNTWLALVRPARKVVPGETLLFPDPATPEAPPLLTAEVLADGDFGERTLRFHPAPNFLDILERIGSLPLPPYIHRDREHLNTPVDRERYQTVYARPSDPAAQRSAAAPTAGLHFTPAILDQLRGRGVEIETITLHVGLGTFQPVRVSTLAEIRLHAERYTLYAHTAEALNRARREGRRIVAAGTTTTRTLEHCALEAERAGLPDLAPHSGETRIFLAPGHRFRLVSGLLTNFHLPESTLLMLVSAFAGREPVLAAYRHAVAQRYRFFSYGDCMLLL